MNIKFSLSGFIKGVNYIYNDPKSPEFKKITSM